MGMEQSAVPSPERLPPPSAWAYPLKTKAGRAAYALRKQAV
jgi:hypothetical protein